MAIFVSDKEVMKMKETKNEVSFDVPLKIIKGNRKIK